MKKEIADLEVTYDSCIASGMIKEKSVDIELIKSLKVVSEDGLNFIKKVSTGIPKDSTDWTFVFREYYESLRGLIKAYLLFDGIETDNHQCNNAYLCLKHPELEADWEFLEMSETFTVSEHAQEPPQCYKLLAVLDTIRLKRNAVNYRGVLLKYDDWSLFKMKFELYISLMKKKVEEKLAKND